MGLGKLKGVVGCSLSITLLVGAGWLAFEPPGFPTTALAAPPASTVDSTGLTNYAAMQSLRDEIAATDVDLASVGCTADQAKLVLNNVKVWFAQNKAALDRVDADIRSAQSQVELMVHDINVGPKTDAVISAYPALALGLKDAKDRRVSLINAAATSAVLPLNAEQRQMLQNALANDGLPDRYRYLSIDEATRTSLKKAKRGAVNATLETQAASKASTIAAVRQSSFAAIIEAEQQAWPKPEDYAKRQDAIVRPTPALSK